MSEELKKLILFIASKSEKESGLLYPNPAWNIDAHYLLAEIVRLFNLNEKEVSDLVDSVTHED